MKKEIIHRCIVVAAVAVYLMIAFKDQQNQTCLYACAQIGMMFLYISGVSYICSYVTFPASSFSRGGMLRFMSDRIHPSLPTPFYSAVVSISVFMVLSTVFHSIHSHDNSPFSDSVLLFLSLPCWSSLLSLYECLLQP